MPELSHIDPRSAALLVMAARRASRLSKEPEMSAVYPTRVFLDNLVPLKGGIDGPQLAGWTPGGSVKSGLGCVLYADQMIPVDENVSLAADVYIPKVAGRYPTIVVFSAYSKELHSTGAPTGTNEVGSPPVFTDRGYAHVVVARRGMGHSQGSSVVFCNDTDGDDHAKIIAWAAAQPWCSDYPVPPIAPATISALLALACPRLKRCGPEGRLCYECLGAI